MYIHNKKNGYERTGNKIVDDILEETYGAIVYQEQTMLLMNRLTGGKWSLGKADSMRKVKDLEEYREDFVKCCKDNNIDSDFSDNIFNRFDLGYTFNKSHATAYSFISAQCAWLMQNYRKEFMSAVMSMEMSKTDNDLAKQIKECNKHGIKVLPPDINFSTNEFNPIEEGIVFPLSAIQGVGDKAVEVLIANRPYKNVEDLTARVPKKQANKKVITALIKSGAFDLSDTVYQGNRNKMLEAYLNDGSNMMTWSKDIQSQYEKELLGISLTVDPMGDFPSVPLNNFKDGIIISVPGIVNSVKIITDKNDNKMAFVQCDNNVETFEVIFFARTYAQYQQVLVDNVKLLVTGKKEGNKILADKVRLL